MTKIGCDYFDDHIKRGFLKKTKEDLKDVNFDTLVGTGLSGSLAIARLAPYLKKHALIIRKPNDGTHADYQLAYGKVGKRWLFIDDFISSGATKRRVIEAMEKVARDFFLTLTCVGYYEYRYQNLTLVEGVSASFKEVAHGSNGDPDPQPQSLPVQGDPMVPHPSAPIGKEGKDLRGTCPTTKGEVQLDYGKFIWL